LCFYALLLILSAVLQGPPLKFARLSETCGLKNEKDRSLRWQFARLPNAEGVKFPFLARGNRAIGNRATGNRAYR
jgi:hypothetical protein